MMTCVGVAWIELMHTVITADVPTPRVSWSGVMSTWIAPTRQVGSHGSRMSAGLRRSSQLLLLFRTVNGRPVGMSRVPTAPPLVQAACAICTCERSGSWKWISVGEIQVVRTSTEGLSKITVMAEFVELGRRSKFSP